RVQTQQVIYLAVDKSANQPGLESQRRGSRQQIGVNGSVVPSEMPIRARLIFPGVSPVGAGGDHDHGSLDRTAELAFAEAAQGMISRVEMIDAGWRTGERAADQIQLDLVEGAGTSCGAEENLAEWIGAALCDSG